MDVKEQIKKKMTGAVDHLKEKLKGLRTGRANISMVEGVFVEVYGSRMRLQDLASLSTPEPRLILIAPYDASNAPAIAKAIEAANLNLLAVLDKNVIRIKVPEMDANLRQSIVKQAKEECEKTKVSIRNVRREGNELIKKQKAEGVITEDILKKLEKEIQKLTDDFCKLADDTTAAKEKEILTI